MEKRGVPTGVVIAPPFKKIAEFEMLALGLLGVAMVEVDYSVGAGTASEAQGFIRQAEEQVLAAMLGSKA